MKNFGKTWILWNLETFLNWRRMWSVWDFPQEGTTSASPGGWCPEWRSSGMHIQLWNYWQFRYGHLMCLKRPNLQVKDSP